MNINTAFSDDGENVLAYSELAYAWLDQYGSSAAYAIRDAARAVLWHPRQAKAVGATRELLSWFTGLPLLHFTRSPDVRRNADEVADRFDLTSEQRRFLYVAGSSDRLPNAEDYLNSGRPTVLRSDPRHPLIVGNDVVVKGVPLEDGRASFLGVLVDQHTIIGRGFVFSRPQLAPDEVDVIELTLHDVEQINSQVASKAATIAGSESSLVLRLAKVERARRLQVPS